MTHDRGKSWSTPQVISGNAVVPFVFVPTVTADNRIFVAFLDFDDFTTGRDTYKVVEVSRANGGRLFGPVAVAKVIDGFNDYPLAFGRQTYEDSLFRSWAAGTSRPIRRMRHICRSYGPTCATVRRRPSRIPTPPRRTRTWSSASRSTMAGRGQLRRQWRCRDQQFQPGAHDSSGLLRIGTFDRRMTPRTTVTGTHSQPKQVPALSVSRRPS